jgi:hypothetical protein
MAFKEQKKKKTELTGQQPLAGKVSANLCRQRVLCGQRNESPQLIILAF